MRLSITLSSVVFLLAACGSSAEETTSNAKTIETNSVFKAKLTVSCLDADAKIVADCDGLATKKVTVTSEDAKGYKVEYASARIVANTSALGSIEAKKAEFVMMGGKLYAGVAVPNSTPVPGYRFWLVGSREADGSVTIARPDSLFVKSIIYSSRDRALAGEAGNMFVDESSLWLVVDLSRPDGMRIVDPMPQGPVAPTAE